MPYLFPHACFDCRKSFKRAYHKECKDRKCPHCGGQVIRLGRKFKAPKTGDTKQWEKVEQLVEAGFRFRTVLEWSGEGEMYFTATYPETLREVPDFISRFSSQLQKKSHGNRRLQAGQGYERGEPADLPIKKASRRKRR